MCCTPRQPADEKPKCPAAHSLQGRPDTPGLHEHIPVSWSQSALNEPVMLQAHGWHPSPKFRPHWPTYSSTQMNTSNITVFTKKKKFDNYN